MLWLLVLLWILRPKITLQFCTSQAWTLFVFSFYWIKILEKYTQDAVASFQDPLPATIIIDCPSRSSRNPSMLADERGPADWTDRPAGVRIWNWRIPAHHSTQRCTPLRYRALELCRALMPHVCWTEGYNLRGGNKEMKTFRIFVFSNDQNWPAALPVDSQSCARVGVITARVRVRDCANYYSHLLRLWCISSLVYRFVINGQQRRVIIGFCVLSW